MAGCVTSVSLRSEPETMGTPSDRHQWIAVHTCSLTKPHVGALADMLVLRRYTFMVLQLSCDVNVKSPIHHDLERSGENFERRGPRPFSCEAVTVDKAVGNIPGRKWEVLR